MFASARISPEAVITRRFCHLVLVTVVRRQAVVAARCGWDVFPRSLFLWYLRGLACHVVGLGGNVSPVPRSTFTCGAEVQGAESVRVVNSCVRRREFVAVSFSGACHFHGCHVDGIFVLPGYFASSLRVSSAKGSVGSDLVVAVVQEQFRVYRWLQVVLSNEFTKGELYVACFGEDQ